MTTGQEANRIANRFYQGSVFDYDKEGHLKEVKKAKERTKICVQEILDAVTTIADKKFDFYTEVLKEVDLL